MLIEVSRTSEEAAQESSSARAVAFTERMNLVVTMLHNNGIFPADYLEHSLWEVEHLPDLISDYDAMLNGTDKYGLLAVWESEKEIFPQRTVEETLGNIRRKKVNLTDRYEDAVWNLERGVCIVRFGLTIPGAPLYPYTQQPERWTLNGVQFSSGEGVSEYIQTLVAAEPEHTIEVKYSDTKYLDQPPDIDIVASVNFC